MPGERKSNPEDDPNAGSSDPSYLTHPSHPTHLS